MKSLRTLFEYQKFRPNAKLQAKIDAVAKNDLRGCAELSDEEMDVAAAGEPPLWDLLSKKGDADIK